MRSGIYGERVDLDSFKLHSGEVTPIYTPPSVKYESLLAHVFPLCCTYC